MIGKTVKEQLENDLGLEEAAIAVLHESIAACNEAGDHMSRELLEQILADEEGHVDWIEAQLHLRGEVVRPPGLPPGVAQALAGSGSRVGRGSGQRKGASPGGPVRGQGRPRLRAAVLPGEGAGALHGGLSKARLLELKPVAGGACSAGRRKIEGRQGVSLSAAGRGGRSGPGGRRPRRCRARALPASRLPSGCPNSGRTSFPGTRGCRGLRRSARAFP